MSEDPVVLMRQANQLTREKRPKEAMEVYHALLASHPHFADAWYNLAVLQRHSFQLEEALTSYQKALDAGISRPEEVLVNRSVIYTNYLHDHVSASRELQLSLSLNPGYTPAIMNLATLHEDLGQRQEASALYAKVPPGDVQAYEALARFANLQPVSEIDSQLIVRVQTALAQASLASDRASLGFALGRLLDASGRYREAFGAYQAANRDSGAAAADQAAPYDQKRQEQFVDFMISEGRPRASAARNNESPRPIFICGMFRSGSTLIEQLIGTLPGVAAAGEIDFIPYFINSELVPLRESLAALTQAKLDEVAARYRAELRRAFPQAAFVTDKRPDNFLYLGIIKSLFPDARIVHTLRDPLDNALSIYFLHLEQQMSYALDLDQIGHYYREYRRLMTHWKQQFGDDIFDLSYDALVQDPNITFARLCKFLGLPWSGEMPQVTLRSTAIKTASSWQVREPLYASSSGRARNYAEELEGLRRSFQDLT